MVVLKLDKKTRVPLKNRIVDTYILLTLTFFYLYFFYALMVSGYLFRFYDILAKYLCSVFVFFCFISQNRVKTFYFVDPTKLNYNTKKRDDQLGYNSAPSSLAEMLAHAYIHMMIIYFMYRTL